MPRRVLVIGGGVSGLTCAAVLLEQGHEVTVAAEDEGIAGVSGVAGALWYLPRGEQLDGRVIGWAMRSYDRFQTLVGSPTGIVHRGCLEQLRSNRDLSDLANALPGFRVARDDELRAGASGGFVSGPLPVVTMGRYLPWLVRSIRRRGRIVQRRFGSLNEAVTIARGAGFDAIVNATGLGARELVNDPSVQPIRGQVVRVEPTGLDRVILDEDHPAGVVYLIPRLDDIVCGGVRAVGDASTTIDRGLERAILARCATVEPGVATARILSRGVGLRPGRPSVRLEAESIDGIDVVHDYGHAGNGVTLSWGCAEDVADLLT